MLIGGRRGQAVRNCLVKNNTILSANDWQGRQEILSRPIEIGRDGLLPSRKGVDALIVPLYVGRYAKTTSRAAFNVLCTFTRGGGKPLKVRVHQDYADNFSSDGVYTKREVVPALYEVNGGAFLPWQCEMDSNSNNRHERGELRLRKT